jgi:hypothetical protein
MELKEGVYVRIYDACFQRDFIEPIVKIVNNVSYGELIYTKRKHSMGYDERLIRRGNIKEIYTSKKGENEA